MQISKRQRARGLRQTLLMMVLDAAFINIAFLLALLFRFEMQQTWLFRLYFRMYLRWAWPALTAGCVGCFALFRLYNRLWKYAGVEELLSLVFASGLCMGLMLGANEICYRAGLFTRCFPRTAFAVTWLLLYTFAGSLRLLLAFFARGAHSNADSAERRVLLVGAGFAGAQVIREFRATGGDGRRIVCVVDDDINKANSRLNRVKVENDISRVPELVKQYRIDEIIVAIPSASPEQLRRILGICSSADCRVQMIPAMKDVSDNALQVSSLRDVSINDLLSRDEVHLSTDSIREYLTDKVVLVTGGGGSIGSELCRQIARFQPRQLIIFDIYENNAYDLQTELNLLYGDALPVRVLIGSVRDVKRLEAVFEEYRPSVVFHAAAHKHVPLMEDSPAEAIKNNVAGTINVARCADKYGANRFVMPSTDKAVNPTNVMGASKRVAELAVQTMARHSKTQYMVVRFGNVLGSNGSVIPKFKSQIAAGGPVTVTDPRMTRYFMTIPEASQLVLEACSANESGKIFVLDMGTPVKILDLARNLIRLAGYKPDEDIKIVYTGPRPGEKINEELFNPLEQAGMEKTAHEKIFVAPATPLDEADFRARLANLLRVAAEDPENVREAIRAVVPEYTELAEGEAG